MNRYEGARQTGLRDELYVGYLPMPSAHARVLRWLVPALIWIVGVAGLVWARAQSDPGSAVWQDARPESFSGVYLSAPYPMLILDPSPSAKAEDSRCILLVEEGKHGGRVRSDLNAKRVRASGFPLRRNGRMLLELAPGDRSLSLVEDSVGATPHTSTEPAFSLSSLQESSAGEVRVQGEIVDAKCFFGAMKPGDGRTHKACATLCIRGGIPAMLVARDLSGIETSYLLTTSDGRPLGSEFLGLVADPVEATGELVRCAGINILRVQRDGIRRLSNPSSGAGRTLFSPRPGRDVHDPALDVCLCSLKPYPRGSCAPNSSWRTLS